MLKVSVKGFDWDAGNRLKCTRHGLAIKEIEDFFRGKILVLGDEKHSRIEKRFIGIGRAGNGRPMFVGFTVRLVVGGVLIRPITARYMHAKEASRYEKAFSDS